MKNPSIKTALSFLFLTFILLTSTLTFGQNTDGKPKIGFLVHDLVSERWQKDMDNFVNKVEELGGIAMARNAFGDPATQINQGKMLIDDGVKVLAIIATDGKALSELVDYANKKGVKVIAYDRLIMNCDVDYYISFNSIKVGELMAEYAVKRKPSGNYIMVHGPSSDNNALLVREGQMNILKPYIDSGDIRIIFNNETNSWGSLDALILMDEFLSSYNGKIDVVLAASDGLATGTIDALRNNNFEDILVTGQDASLEACKNIILGDQSMTIYKSIKKLSAEAAFLAMNIANGEAVQVSQYTNNGKKDVPSILFEPVAVDKSNLNETVIADGHIKKGDL